MKLFSYEQKQEICFKCKDSDAGMDMSKKVDISKMHKKISDYHRNLIINTKIFYVLNRAW